jgi:hypothetical protein
VSDQPAPARQRGFPEEPSKRQSPNPICSAGAFEELRWVGQLPGIGNAQIHTRLGGHEHADLVRVAGAVAVSDDPGLDIHRPGDVSESSQAQSRGTPGPDCGLPGWRRREGRLRLCSEESCSFLLSIPSAILTTTLGTALGAESTSSRRNACITRRVLRSGRQPGAGLLPAEHY